MSPAFIVDASVGFAWVGLSVYDAVYLETALRRELPLGSRDQPLRRAAKRCGLRVRG